MNDRTKFTHLPKTIRDEFAMAALTGVLAAESQDIDYSPDTAARRAYAIADAMMVEREEKEGQG